MRKLYLHATRLMDIAELALYDCFDDNISLQIVMYFAKFQEIKKPSILKHLEQDLLFLLLKAHVTGAGILCQPKGEGWMQREQRKPQNTGTVPKSEEHGNYNNVVSTGKGDLWTHNTVSSFLILPGQCHRLPTFFCQ